MSAEREHAVSARTKLAIATRLIEEARAELTLALPNGNQVIEFASELMYGAKRTSHLVELVMKRIP